MPMQGWIKRINRYPIILPRMQVTASTPLTSSPPPPSSRHTSAALPKQQLSRVQRRQRRPQRGAAGRHHSCRFSAAVHGLQVTQALVIVAEKMWFTFTRCGQRRVTAPHRSLDNIACILRVSVAQLEQVLLLPLLLLLLLLLPTLQPLLLTRRRLFSRSTATSSSTAAIECARVCRAA